MILDEAIRLKEIAGEVSVRRRSEQHGQSIIHRKQLVDEILTRAAIATASAKLLAERLGDPWVSPTSNQPAAAALDRWKGALDEDLGEALSGDLFSKFQDAVDKTLREIERRVTGSWQRYIAQVTPETSPEILDALASDPTARTTVLTIRRLAETIRRLRERQVPTAEEISEFEEAVVDLRKAWSTLDVASLNEEVVAFLRAANSDSGAPISLLTPSVISWLAQRDLWSHYTIRPTD